MTAHIHAEDMALYAQDAMETDKPWERWECKYTYQKIEEWETLAGNPFWDERLQYRRKPRTININGFEVPEPRREPLEEGGKFFLLNVYSGIAFEKSWDGQAHEDLLRCGMVHLTREAAEIHAKALMSFTMKEGEK